MTKLPLTSPLGPTLETARLILRPPVAEDFPGFCAFQSDPKVMAHLGGVTSDAVTWRVTRSIAGAWALDGFHMFSVIEKDSGAWIGRIGALYPHQWPAREVGWGVLSSAWGKGYAKEAALACMDYVFDVLNWEDVIHTIAPDNAGSQGVAKSLGSYNRGPGRLPEPYADAAVDIWGQTRAEWRENRKRHTV
ncbi:GNAT family N-acetyltransferase [Asticcacaulis sp. BYS171W]|uniref:GNAT family N-acetyltransferase n=1 Tax=Asticcacaulis aquaticus TaxID=2984212 RepID=A0ABT5HRD0_9CAUL|nr:GNAT family N-acetyltransferase [Asticcacaulis aquaticus]MDC7682623.1 GNAT family N-acetyltransferase [Asticcacaulis aquaticus]